jgi:hypothetical protein
VGVALKALTVGFHEAGFAATLNQENRQPFWFQLSAEERQQVGSPWGPQNPQALNRYSYVLNNPLRWTDPSGHSVYMSHEQAAEFVKYLREFAGELYLEARGMTNNVEGVLAAVANFFGGVLAKPIYNLFLNLKALKWEKIATIYAFAEYVEQVNAESLDGVAIATGANSRYGYDAYILNRSTGDVMTLPLGYLSMLAVFGAGNEWDIGIAYGDDPFSAPRAFADDMDGRGIGPEGFCPPDARSC